MKKLNLCIIFIIVAIVSLVKLGEVLAQTTERVSVASNGDEGNNGSSEPSISTDGRYVSFASDASNLVVGDTNGVSDIFVHERNTGVTTRVSVSSDSIEGNGDSSFTRISTDGRYVVFHSDATNLVVNDTNGSRDIFVHDRSTGETTRVSVSSDGTQGNGDSAWANRISTDGRYVSFASDASNLVVGDTNGVSDVFVHDRQTGETTRVSVSSGGVESNGANGWGTISHDGRYVGFFSDASNLVVGDTNGVIDVFVHDRNTGETTRVSVSSDGTQGNGDSDQISISTDGRYVGYLSDASNLVANDTNGSRDIFVHDRQTSETTRVSVSSNGAEGNDFSSRPNISSDGRYVTFHSDATNLVVDDTNGSRDIFIHDRQAGEATRVSVSSSGAQANGHSTWNYTSSDGRYVTFRSEASNLVVDDTNGVADIFVNDRVPNGGGNGGSDGGGAGGCFIATAAW